METRIEQIAGYDVCGYGLATHMGEDAQHEVPAFWQKYLKSTERTALNALAKGGQPAAEYGVCYGFEQGTEAFRYLIGIALPEGTPLPPGAERVHIPAGLYVVGLTDPAPPEDFPPSIGRGWGELMGNWLPQSGYVAAGGPQFELYDERSDPDRAKLQIEIWIPLRKP